jgi:hypothetical protein
MKKPIALLIAVLLALSPPPLARAQVVVTNYPLFALYDLDSTTAISCVYGPETTLQGTATTSGSSATTTSTNAAFTSLIATDLVWATISGQKTGRYVSARASAASMTVDTAWTLPAGGVTLRKQSVACGTAATSGWVAVDGASMLVFSVDLKQVVLGTGAVGFKIEGMSLGSTTGVVTNLWPGNDSTSAKCDSGTYASGYCTFTTADTFTVSSAGVQRPMFVRLVAILTGTDDGNDLTTNLEQINADLQVTR